MLVRIRQEAQKTHLESSVKDSLFFVHIFLHTPVRIPKYRCKMAKEMTDYPEGFEKFENNSYLCESNLL